MKAQGESRCTPRRYMRVSGQRLPRPLYPRERDAVSILQDISACLDRCGISRPPPGFDPRTIHLVANRNNGGSIPSTQFIIRIRMHRYS